MMRNTILFLIVLVTSMVLSDQLEFGIPFNVSPKAPTAEEMVQAEAQKDRLQRLWLALMTFGAAVVSDIISGFALWLELRGERKKSTEKIEKDLDCLRTQLEYILERSLPPRSTEEEEKDKKKKKKEKKDKKKKKEKEEEEEEEISAV